MRTHHLDIPGKGTQRWDHFLAQPSGRVKADTAHVDPHKYVGQTMRCRVGTSSAWRTVTVRVDAVSKNGRQAWVVELDGRCAGRKSRVLVENLHVQ